MSAPRDNVQLLSDLTAAMGVRISNAEICWTFERMKQLKAEGVPASEWSAIVKEESASRPWERQ